MRTLTCLPQVKAKSGYVLPIPASDKPGGMTISIFLINAAKRVVVRNKARMLWYLSVCFISIQTTKHGTEISDTNICHHVEHISYQTALASILPSRTFGVRHIRYKKSS